MATLESRGMASDDADEWRARSVQPHSQQWKGDVYTWAPGGGNNPVVLGIPITGGTLTIDSSAQYRRHLHLELGGGEQWSPVNPNSPLVPFGQRIFLYSRIDRYDGSWLPWLKMGEFWITDHVFERPSLIVTVEADDYGEPVDEFLHLNRKSYANHSVRGAIVQMVNDALPNNGFTVHADDQADNVKVANFVADAAQGRWDAATKLASKFGREVLFDAQGNLVIRHDITDDQNDTIPGTGPDIGTVANPIAIIKDGQHGNMVGMTASVSRKGACNGVAFALTSTVTKKIKVKKKKKSVSHDVFRTVTAFQPDGPVAWGDQFGRVPIVVSQSVNKITADLINNRQQRANHLLHRRRGLTRYIDLDALPLLWLEADDKIRVTWHAHTDVVSEAHYVQSVIFDIAGGPMQIKTRALSVTDPGS